MSRRFQRLIKSVCLGKLGSLERSLVQVRVGELSPGHVHRQEDIECNAAPLDSIQGAKQFGASNQLCRSSKRRDARLDKVPEKICRNRHRKLREKISRHLGGVVPPCVLEVEKADVSIGFAQRVVEAKIGRRYATRSEEHT